MDTGDKEKPTKNLELRAPRGMEDILPHQWRLWRWLEDTAREIFVYFLYFSKINTVKNAIKIIK